MLLTAPPLRGLWWVDRNELLQKEAAEKGVDHIYGWCHLPGKTEWTVPDIIGTEKASHLA